MELTTCNARRVLTGAVLLGLLSPWSGWATVHTKGFTGVLSCFSNCAPASAETAFLAGAAFTGTYSYDDAVVPTSGDPTTFRDYGSGVNVSLNIGSGVYTLVMANGALEIARNHYSGRKDDVYLSNMPSVFGGTGMASFTPVVPTSGSFQSYLKYSNNVGANILPDTLIANWPQTIAAWSPNGFAGIEFYIQDASANIVGFHGAFLTLFDAAVPTLSTSATASVGIGGTISDTVTLSGGSSPTGTVTFTVFGPGDATCASPPVFTVPVTVAGGTATGTVTPVAVGVYRWIASYGGDGSNAAVAGACNDANESSNVTLVTPTVSSTGSPHGSAVLGTSLSDSAALAAGFNPTGTMIFRLYGPSDPTCAGPSAFTSPAVPVNGNGAYASASFAPAVPGTYSWVASYSGDPNNAAASEPCGQTLATVQLAAPPVVTVPTLSSAALLLLTLGLGAAGVWGNRRVRRRR